MLALVAIAHHHRSMEREDNNSKEIRKHTPNRPETLPRIAIRWLVAGTAFIVPIGTGSLIVGKQLIGDAYNTSRAGATQAGDILTSKLNSSDLSHGFNKLSSTLQNNPNLSKALTELEQVLQADAQAHPNSVNTSTGSATHHSPPLNTTTTTAPPVNYGK